MRHYRNDYDFILNLTLNVKFLGTESKIRFLHLLLLSFKNPLVRTGPDRYNADYFRVGSYAES
jgi:hypothetical protein